MKGFYYLFTGCAIAESYVFNLRKWFFSIEMTYIKWIMEISLEGFFKQKRAESISKAKVI